MCDEVLFFCDHKRRVRYCWSRPLLTSPDFWWIPCLDYPQCILHLHPFQCIPTILQSLLFEYTNETNEQMNMSTIIFFIWLMLSQMSWPARQTLNFGWLPSEAISSSSVMEGSIGSIKKLSNLISKWLTPSKKGESKKGWMCGICEWHKSHQIVVLYF